FVVKTLSEIRRYSYMCHHPHYRHSIFCILPPHVLIAIAKNGTPEQRQAAIDALNTDTTFRTYRMTFNFLGGPLGREDVTGGPPQKQRTIYNANNTETLPGQVVRSEGGAAVGDASVNEAYDG